MIEELKCPHCGSVNIDTDVCNDTYRTDDKVIKEYSGFCMDCGTCLTWEENFQFESYSNIKIDN
jgi:hypothetical protein